MPTTADVPKCFAEIGGRRILDWTVEALTIAGIDSIGFIGGYRIEAVQAEYPQFEFRHNLDWPNNNILASLFCAEDLMDEPFVCCYSDCLFTPGAEFPMDFVEHALRLKPLDTGGIEAGLRPSDPPR